MTTHELSDHRSMALPIWIPIILREAAALEQSRYELQDRLSKIPEIRRFGSSSDLLGGIRFLRNIGLLAEHDGKIIVTELGREKMLSNSGCQ